MKEAPPFASWSGHCPICNAATVFSSRYDWFRDHLTCASCGSLPRDRAVTLAVESAFPGWRKLKIHESSPCGRGFSILAERECRGYVPTVFIPNVERGSISIENGLRCEDLERQTFRDKAFDIVITQDIMEHL